MDEQEIARLRDHYDKADLSTEIERARWETDVETDPMVTTSLRLPKSLLDWVREQAETEQVKPTALIRRWIEQQRAEPSADVGGRLERLVERLEHVVAGDGGTEATVRAWTPHPARASWARSARSTRTVRTGRWFGRTKKVIKVANTQHVDSSDLPSSS
jgi:hypothetical protein